jgi:hypothetical protein
MIYQVHYQDISGKFLSEYCESKTPKDAIETVKQKYQDIKILQVTMDIKTND